MERHGALISGFAQLAVILVAAGAASAIARRLGQAGVVGIMIAGLALGASGLGVAAPALFRRLFDSSALAHMETLSQLGVVLLVFSVGLTTNFSHVVHREGRRVVIALTAAGIPLAFAIGTTFGFLSSHVLAPRIPALPFALFIGTAFSITALPVLGRILAELGIARSRLASIGIAAAGSSDAVGWLLLSVVGAIASATLAPGPLLLQMALLAAFLLAARYVMRPLFARYLDAVHESSVAAPATAIAGGLTLLFLAAVTTSAIGVFPAFGAFVAGAITYDRQRFVALWSTGAEPFVQAFFVPIYFCFTGLRTDIGALSTPADWTWCAVLTATTLTMVRNLHARKLHPTGGATLSGQLQQTNSCNKVSFKQMTIVPPVYQAVQQRVRLVGCVILNGHYVSASILVPRNAPFVTVRAKNGPFKVPVT